MQHEAVRQQVQKPTDKRFVQQGGLTVLFDADESVGKKQIEHENLVVLFGEDQGIMDVVRGLQSLTRALVEDAVEFQVREASQALSPGFQEDPYPLTPGPGPNGSGSEPSQKKSRRRKAEKKPKKPAAEKKEKAPKKAPKKDGGGGMRSFPRVKVLSRKGGRDHLECGHDLEVPEGYPPRARRSCEECAKATA